MDPELFDKFVTETGKRITSLRSEAARHRLLRNEARDELVAVKAELEALKATK
jgi:hypothetical protein